MRCPYCSAEKNHLNVIDSRSCDGENSIRRRRECEICHKRFTTYERVEQTTRLMVVKKDGQRKPWEGDKILAGLERAAYKRPIPKPELVRIRDEVEEEVFARYDREVPTSVVGQLVTERLRRVDQVAYVRFASVYRQFKTLEELVDEARAVLDARRYEDPTQGRLFLEPPGTEAQAAQGGDSENATAPAGETNGEKPRRTRRRAAQPQGAPNGKGADKEGAHAPAGAGDAGAAERET
jgi:transcriptional repressor NrdR